jgi:hypothetical protein
MQNFDKKYTIYNVHEEKVDTNIVIPIHRTTTTTSARRIENLRLSMCKMPSIATLSMDYSKKQSSIERKESEKRQTAAISSSTSKKVIQLHKAGTMHFNQ